jgi:hypothetical protein
LALKRDDRFSAVAFTAPVGRASWSAATELRPVQSALGRIIERARHRLYCDNFVAGQSRSRDDQTIPP